jgi:hypothetical protein
VAVEEAVKNPMHSEPDAFVSHSSRDKAMFVRPLVECLDEQGLLLWYDEYSLQPGDSLSVSIDQGLARASSGIVVISPAFIETARASGWTQYELRGIVSNSIGPQGRRIVPVWFNVNREDVLAWSPSISDLIAVDASGRSIEDVALELLRVLAPDRSAGLARMRSVSTARGEKRMVDPREVVLAPTKDRRVPGDVPLRALLVTNALADCGFDFASDLDGFLENLSSDLHHEQELRVWEAIAASYQSANQAVQLDEAQRAALFKVLLAASWGVVDEAEVEALSPEVAGPALKQFQQLLRLVRSDAVIGAGGIRGYIPEKVDEPEPDGSFEQTSEFKEP